MKFRVGDRVRLNKNKKEFYYSRGGVSYDEIGTIEAVDKDEYVVNFPSHLHWFGKEDELKRVDYTYEDLKKSPIGTKLTFENGAVLVKDEESHFENVSRCRDVANLYNLKDNYSDLGKIIKIEEPEYKTVFERKEEILDKTEKNYLRGVIRPFRDRIKYIRKITFSDGDAKISIKIKENIHTWYIELPPFKKDVMYKNMEPNKEYSLEGLGL